MQLSPSAVPPAQVLGAGLERTQDPNRCWSGPEDTGQSYSASQILWSFSKALINRPQAEARATPAAISNSSPNSIFLFQGSEQDREAAAEVDNGVLRLFDFLMTFIQTQ